MSTMTRAGIPPATTDNQSFLLKRIQPALSGLMDGSLSTLAPIFAVILATHHPLTAFYTGAATALVPCISMAFSEDCPDTGDLTGRGRPVLRGAITGGGRSPCWHLPHPAVPDSRLQRGDQRRDQRGGCRAAHPGLASPQVLPDQLRSVIPRGHRRRSNHRLAERRPRHPRGWLNTRPSEPTPHLHPHHRHPYARRTCAIGHDKENDHDDPSSHHAAGLDRYAPDQDRLRRLGHRRAAGRTPGAARTTFRRSRPFGTRWSPESTGSTPPPFTGSDTPKRWWRPRWPGCPRRTGPTSSPRAVWSGIGPTGPRLPAGSARRRSLRTEVEALAAAAAGRADRPVPAALAGRGRHAAGGVLAGLHRSQARGQDPRGGPVQPRHLAAGGG